VQSTPSKTHLPAFDNTIDSTFWLVSQWKPPNSWVACQAKHRVWCYVAAKLNQSRPWEMLCTLNQLCNPVCCWSQYPVRCQLSSHWQNHQQYPLASQSSPLNSWVACWELSFDLMLLSLWLHRQAKLLSGAPSSVPSVSSMQPNVSTTAVQGNTHFTAIDTAIISTADSHWQYHRQSFCWAPWLLSQQGGTLKPHLGSAWLADGFCLLT